MWFCAFQRSFMFIHGLKTTRLCQFHNVWWMEWAFWPTFYIGLCLCRQGSNSEAKKNMFFSSQFCHFLRNKCRNFSKKVVGVIAGSVCRHIHCCNDGTTFQDTFVCPATFSEAWKPKGKKSFRLRHPRSISGASSLCRNTREGQAAEHQVHVETQEKIKQRSKRLGCYYPTPPPRTPQKKTKKLTKREVKWLKSHTPAKKNWCQMEKNTRPSVGRLPTIHIY